MYIVIGIIISLLILFIYSCCVVSSRCSREEEYRETMRLMQKKFKEGKFEERNY